MKNLLIALSLVLSIVLGHQSFAAESSKESGSKKEIVLSKDNVIVLDSEVDGLSVSKVSAQAHQLDASLKSGYPIVLVLNTPGGSIDAGMELIESLKSLNRPVDTLTIFAASMGFQIAQNLNQRYILDYGTLMSHKAFGGFQGQFSDGMSQLDSRYNFWLRRIKQMDDQTVKRTNGKQTLKSYRDAYQNEMWLTGSESVDGGYADAVVNARCDASLQGNHTVNIEFFGMTFQLVFSDCPLISSPIDIKVMVHTNEGSLPLSEFLAKGGLMGVDCPPTTGTYSSGYSYDFSTGSTIYGPPAPTTNTNTGTNGPKSTVCALDKTLTVEKINQEKDKLQAQYSLQGHRKDIVLKP